MVGVEWLFWLVHGQKKTGTLCIIWANTLLKSAPPRLHNWRTDKLVMMSWNEQRVDWHAGTGVTPSLTLGALQAAIVSHGAEELEDEDGDSHHRQAHNEHHHPHRWAVGLCNTHKNTRKYQINFSRNVPVICKAVTTGLRTKTLCPEGNAEETIVMHCSVG